MKTFLPVIVVAILKSNTLEQNIVIKANERYTKIYICGSSAAVTFRVKLH